MTRTPWPAARAATFVRLWHAGASPSVIAAATGISPSSVGTMASHLRSWGHDVPHRTGGRGPWTSDRVAPVVDAIGRGVDDVDLARLMGVAVRSVPTTLSRLRHEGHAIPLRIGR